MSKTKNPTKADLQILLHTMHSAFAMQLASMADRMICKRRNLAEHPNREWIKDEMYALKQALWTLQGSLSRMAPENRRAVIELARTYSGSYRAKDREKRAAQTSGLIFEHGTATLSAAATTELVKAA